jgi:hypothetical protein
MSDPLSRLPVTSELSRRPAPRVRVSWPEAVRAAPGVAFTPREGYRRDRFDDPRTGLAVPALAAAAGVDRLFDLFLALLEPLGPVVDVILESSHAAGGPAPRKRRAGADRPVAASYLCEFEDELLGDGCAGVCVVGTRGPMEVQFDEHKTLVVYARNRRPFRDIVRGFGLRRRDDLVLVSEVRHVHRTTPAHVAAFRQLAERFGV